MCQVAPELFEQAEVLLAPKKQQHWVLAMVRPDILSLPAEKREKYIANEAVDWFRHRSGVFADSRQIDFTGYQVGNPAALLRVNQTKLVQRAPGNVEQFLPSDTIYAAIAFSYMGDETEVSWPWRTTGLFASCPEELDIGLFATMKPAQHVHVPDDGEQVVDAIGDTIDDIQSDVKETVDGPVKSVASVVIFGGAVVTAIWFYKTFLKSEGGK